MVALVGSLALVSSALGDTTITDFKNFTSDAVYASWATATINSTPTNYIITATGYGSNWKYIPANASGNTNVELTVDLSGPPAADGQLGPIVTLVDTAGVEYNYAWYGQTLGHHVLNMAVDSPTFKGGTAGTLNLTNLNGIHMQLDPGGFGSSGAYTIAWDLLRLTGPSAAATIKITSQSYNRATRQLSLTWTSTAGAQYTAMSSSTVNTGYAALVANIASGGATTSTTVTMPNSNTGFVRIMQQ